MVKNIFALGLAIVLSLGSCARGEKQEATPSAEPESVSTVETTPLKVSVLGDSYSTFEGWIPEGYIAWYKPVPKPGRPTDVTDVEQTWWKKLIEESGYELEVNDSYSGATVCNTGYSGADYSDRSFVNRTDRLGNPDIILVFGGTNDAWANSPLGDYVWSGWTDRQLYSYRPAAAKMLDSLQTLHPDAEIVVIINDDINDDIKNSTREICEHYGVEYVQLEGIEKMSQHPSAKGMQSIVEQVRPKIHKHI